ncbi:MAG: thioredoxin [Sphaerochaetaceae bacterium]|nr:thioredoxin [Sphaerochaetaceae bacterium]
MILHTDSLGFDKLVLDKNSGLVLVDFFATWCGPCKMLGANLEKLDKEVGDKVRIVKIDVDDNPELAGRFGVESIPTMLVYRNGEKEMQVVGARTVDDLKKMLSL